MSAAVRIVGSADRQVVHISCEFCGRPGFWEGRLEEFGGYMKPHYCTGCGRSAYYEFASGVPELVLVAGPDPTVNVRCRDDRPKPPRSPGHLDREPASRTRVERRLGP